MLGIISAFKKIIVPHQRNEQTIHHATLAKQRGRYGTEEQIWDTHLLLSRVISDFACAFNANAPSFEVLGGAPPDCLCRRLVRLSTNFSPAPDHEGTEVNLLMLPNDGLEY
jgi:hypothetical protein